VRQNKEEILTAAQSILKRVRFIVAVAAGKGGVGKSTAAVNLASALQSAGYSVGILDADIYGPSLGKMLKVEIPLQIDPQDADKVLPAVSYGIKTMSLAYLKGEEEAMIVRAPIANGVVMQFLEQVSWGELDFLLVDFPPGTGDVQLTLMQTIPFSGAVIVTTPQEISLLDVKKAVQMFHHMNVPIVGFIENMAYFEEPSAHARHYLFGSGGGKKLSELFGAPLLGEIPIDPLVCQCCDKGESLLLSYPESSGAKAYSAVGERIKNIIYELEETDCVKQFEVRWMELES
jgi:ATP-binding protein involved in chromosome partitioning